MTNPGRNDPCPCGSGKKYKKCCLAVAEDADFTFRQLRQTHAAVIPRLTEYALEALGPDLFHEAWLEFNDHQTTEPFDPESPMTVLFMPGFCSTSSSRYSFLVKRNMSRLPPPRCFYSPR